jgi:hypothetical protein
MRTDDHLTTLLRRGFTHATADLDPEPDLVRVVRRRYARARLRRLSSDWRCLPSHSRSAPASPCLDGTVRTTLQATLPWPYRGRRRSRRSR